MEILVLEVSAEPVEGNMTLPGVFKYLIEEGERAAEGQPLHRVSDILDALEKPLTMTTLGWLYNNAEDLHEQEQIEQFRRRW